MQMLSNTRNWESQTNKGGQKWKSPSIYLNLQVKEELWCEDQTGLFKGHAAVWKGSSLRNTEVPRLTWNWPGQTFTYKACPRFMVLREGKATCLLMSRVKTPPKVSIPRDRGVTSRSTTLFTSPLKTPPWIAAPHATTSSGFTPLEGSFANRFFTISFTWKKGQRLFQDSRQNLKS